MKSKKGTILIATGLLLIAAALLLTGYNLWDADRAEKSSAAIVEQLPPPPVPSAPPAAVPAYRLHPDMEMPTAEIDGNLYIGTLEIPSLGLLLPVMSEWSYPKLRIAPCRYRGSAYQNDLILSAHNYKRHFGQLKTLSPGDEVRFRDMDGNTFRYAVEGVETLEPHAIEEMESGGWDLTMFTCTLGGKARVTVRCTLQRPS